MVDLGPPAAAACGPGSACKVDICETKLCLRLRGGRTPRRLTARDVWQAELAGGRGCNSGWSN
eukprot:9930371-Alexandrium_andersonii.AAC.1